MKEQRGRGSVMMDADTSDTSSGGPMAGFADVIFSAGAVYTADAQGRRLVQARTPSTEPASAVAVAAARSSRSVPRVTPG